MDTSYQIPSCLSESQKLREVKALLQPVADYCKKHDLPCLFLALEMMEDDEKQSVWEGVKIYGSADGESTLGVCQQVICAVGLQTMMTACSYELMRRFNQ